MTDSSTQSSKVSIDLTLHDDAIEVKMKPSIHTVTGDVPAMQTLCHAVSSLISHISTRIMDRGDLGKTQWRVGLDKRMTDAGLTIGSVTERTGTSIFSARDTECDSNCPEGLTYDYAPLYVPRKRRVSTLTRSALTRLSPHSP